MAVYSHGMYAWRQIASTTFEMLASHGFVVFSVDHKPSAMVSRPFTARPSDGKGGGGGSAVTFDYLLPDNIEVGSLSERSFYCGGMDRRAREISALLDHLTSPAVSAALSLDTKKINLFGHSFGSTLLIIGCFCFAAAVLYNVIYSEDIWCLIFYKCRCRCCYYLCTRWWYLRNGCLSRRPRQVVRTV